MSGTKTYPDTAPVCVQQGGSTWELYVQFPEDVEEYIADCEEHTYTAVKACDIEVIGKQGDNEIVTLREAIRMAEECLRAAREIIAGY